MRTTVPDHLELWLNSVEKFGGLETEGLFRVSGSVVNIKKLKENAEEGDVDFKDFTVHDIAGLIKMFFRDLPEPLFTSDLYTCFVAAGASKNKDEIMKALDLLPTGHRVVLYRLLSFLNKVVALSKINKMIPENLATCLVPNLLRPKAETMEGAISDYPFQISLFTVLIDSFEYFFRKDIEETQKRKDAIKEKALNYKKMMEQKYKKPPATTTTATTTTAATTATTTAATTSPSSSPSASISSHILDTRTGKPAKSVSVVLEIQNKSKSGVLSWGQLAIGKTNDDGRVTAKEFPTLTQPGVYRAIFNTEEHFQATGVTEYFYPQVTIEFYVKLGSHYHIPLLISPFGYSTYRGS